jgi:hypothetical protein
MGGVDLNRDWSVTINVERVDKSQNLLRKNSKGKFYSGLDFHSTWNDVFLYKTKAREDYIQFINDWFASIEEIYLITK